MGPSVSELNAIAECMDWTSTLGGLSIPAP